MYNTGIFEKARGQTVLHWGIKSNSDKFTYVPEVRMMKTERKGVETKIFDQIECGDIVWIRFEDHFSFNSPRDCVPVNLPLIDAVGLVDCLSSRYIRLLCIMPDANFGAFLGILVIKSAILVIKKLAGKEELTELGKKMIPHVEHPIL